MIFVPIGYKYPTVMDMTEILGGSPYGASSLAGSDGTRQPNAKELELCAFHGQHFTEIVAQFKRYVKYYNIITIMRILTFQQGSIEKNAVYVVSKHQLKSCIEYLNKNHLP